MRVAMARVLLGRPEVLLMDEPTNHLDIESIIWLEGFLKSCRRAPHDLARPRVHEPHRHAPCAEIDDGEITVYAGNYEFYERERAIREANREAAYGGEQAMLAEGNKRFIDRFSCARPPGRAGAEPREGAGQD